MNEFLDDYKGTVARSFGRAAQTYDAAAALQQQIGHELLAELRAVDLSGVSPLILDVGAGTGFFSRNLSAMFPSARVVAVDLAEGMMRRAKQHHFGGCIVGDAEAIPIASGKVDLVFSNMCIQWCRSHDQLFGELRRILKPTGRMVFSTFGPKTLSELRQAWAVSDELDHVIQFLTEAHLAEMLGRYGFCWDSRLVRVECREYRDVFSLMRELKDLGARNASARRPKALTGKGRIAAMSEAYPQNGNGLITASYEILGGTLSVRTGG